MYRAGIEPACCNTIKNILVAGTSFPSTISSVNSAPSQYSKLATIFFRFFSKKNGQIEENSTEKKINIGQQCGTPPPPSLFFVKKRPEKRDRMREKKTSGSKKKIWNGTKGCVFFCGKTENTGIKKIYDALMGGGGEWVQKRFFFLLHTKILR